MRSLILVAGARPNFMKVAPVMAELRRRPALFQPALVHTGQHYDEQMSGVFFTELGLPEPEAHLGAGGGTHGQQTGRILEAFEKYLLALVERPAGVVVVGDVNSTLACALAAVKLHIPVAHLESGLRSFDRAMPEEINRVATDAICDLLLVSEPAGEVNLRREGVPEERIRYVGNVMIDTLIGQLEEARSLHAARNFGFTARDFALVTLHRPSNVDDPARLEKLMTVLKRCSSRLPILFPAHPRTRPKLQSFLGDSGGNLHIVDPRPYRQMLSLQSDAAIVITDSGGIQEEASYLGVPCLTLRANTERPVTITSGTNTLISGDPAEMEHFVEEILAGRYKKGQPIPGWDGRAAERTVDVLNEVWNS